MKGKSKNKQFDSAAQAAAILKMDKRFLLWCKSEGAPGFLVGARVEWGPELRQWIAENGHRYPGGGGKSGDGKRDLECEKLREQIRGIKADNDREAGLTMPVEEHKTVLLIIAEQLKKALHDIYEIQQPPKVEGLRAPEMVAKNREYNARIIELVREA